VVPSTGLEAASSRRLKLANLGLPCLPPEVARVFYDGEVAVQASEQAMQHMCKQCVEKLKHDMSARSVYPSSMHEYAAHVEA